MFIETFFWLLVAHACTDVWWQEARMISEKHRERRRRPREPASLPRPFLKWFPWMLAHALINGAGVAFVTQNTWLGIGETLVHFVTDTLKCEHKIGLASDQFIHLVSKLVWAYAILV